MTRRRWVSIGLAAAVLVGGLVAWRITRPSELDRIRKRLDATDPGWRFADIHAARLADQPPPDENVVLTAVAAAKLIPAEFVAWKAAADADETRPRTLTNRPPPDPAGEAAWRAAAEAVALARRCKDQPRGMADPVIPADPFMTLLPHVDAGRRTTDLLRVDASRSAAHGDAAGAVDSIRAVQNIARGMEREPFLVSHLVADSLAQIAADATLRALAVAELPDGGLAAVEADLRAAADPGRWATTLRDWRAGSDLEMTAIAAGNVDLRTAAGIAGAGRAPPPNLISRLSYRLTAVGTDHAALLEQLTAHLEVARRPPHEWAAAADALPRPPGDERHLFTYSEYMVARNQLTRRLRHLALARTATVAVACEQYRLVHGRWPDTRAELPPGDHSDPYTGAPLRLKRLPDGLVVYSVGPDGRDDGGTLSEVGSPPAGTDVGWRLWDVTARR